MDETSFGSWVKERRAALDLTQRDLAQAVACSAITIQKIEAGARRPSRQIVERLAVALTIPDAERARFMQLGRAQRREPVNAQAAAPLETTLSDTLPVPLTPLIGRADALEALVALFSRDQLRLVTIVGPAGVGKTRLSIAAASQLRPYYGGRVAFIALAALHDPALLLPTIVQGLGLMATDDPAAALVIHLKAHPQLLVLDNVEQLLAAAPTLANLLEACPTLHVLVTSRERLHIRGEHLFPLVPLALPDLGQLPDLPILAETPAVALFCAVARASRPDFVLRAEESAAVARLCVRLDGLPLAIELVAAQLALFPAAMLADLDAARTLDLPGPRDLPDRQRTLRAAIEWSFKLLPEAEQQIVTRLALFAPGWHYDAAFALCNDLVADDQHQLLHALDRLYHASFLQRLASPERFTLLETIRAFVLDRARESGILETFRMRHALHYLALAERAAPELKGSQQQQWKAALDADRDNLLLALDRLLFSGHIAAAARLCIALWRYWWMQGEMRLGRTRIEAVLEHEPALSALLRGQAWYSCAKWRNRQVNQ